MTEGQAPAAHILYAPSIVETLQRLESRITERFPESGLRRVVRELVAAAGQIQLELRELKRPYFALRALAALAAVTWLAATVWVLLRVGWFNIRVGSDPLSTTQALDSMVNLLLLAFAVIWFMLTLEERWKRRRTHKGLHRLRSFAHVIDMHQLTKDPTILLAPEAPTASSPQRRMTEFQLARYLDYCAEMLALTAKLAALYAENTSDSQVLKTVNELEALCSDLGRKIWQKIMILSDLVEAR